MGPLGTQELEGDRLVELGVEDPIDGAHAALAEDRLDRIALGEDLFMEDEFTGFDSGWDRADLRAWIVEDLRIAEFLDQRIYFFVLISPEDASAYHESHRDEYAALTPEEAREAITKRLTQERGDEKQRQFVAALRAKATIRINPPIAAEP